MDNLNQAGDFFALGRLAARRASWSANGHRAAPLNPRLAQSGHASWTIKYVASHANSHCVAQI